MRSLVAALSILCALPLAALADDLPADEAAIPRLVADLGAPDYSVRDLASRRLAELGERARPALVEAASIEDPEVRWRARRLLEALDRPAEPQPAGEDADIFGPGIIIPTGDWLEDPATRRMIEDLIERAEAGGR